MQRLTIFACLLAGILFVSNIFLVYQYRQEKIRAEKAEKRLKKNMKTLKLLVDQIENPQQVPTEVIKVTPEKPKKSYRFMSLGLFIIALIILMFFGLFIKSLITSSGLTSSEEESEENNNEEEDDNV